MTQLYCRPTPGGHRITMLLGKGDTPRRLCGVSIGATAAFDPACLAAAAMAR